MKKILTLILCISLLISAIPFNHVFAKTTIIYGDIDGNLQIDASDSLMLIHHSVRMVSLSDEQLKSADANSDGEVDLRDILAVRKHLAKVELLNNGKFYFVSKDGNDNNDGSEKSPFLTIQQAANVMNAGDICFIKEGVYRETVRPKNSGKAGAPITFIAYKNDNVVISGAEKINTEWTYYKDGIYKTNYTLWCKNANQLFINGEMAQIARFPNKNSDNIIAVGDVLSADSANYNSLSDSDLTQENGFFNGSKIYIEGTSHYLYYGADVTDYKKGNLSFSGLDKNSWDLPCSNSNYYFYDSLKLLDDENEWYYDETEKALYYKPSKDVNPNELNIECALRSEGFNLRDRSYITIENLNVFSTNINTNEGTKNLTLDSNKIEYFYHTMQSRNYPWEAHWFGIELWGDNSVVKNCEIGFGAEGGVEVYANNCSVVNNYIHDINYINCNAAAIETKYGKNTLVSHNTIDNVARSGIVIGSTDMRISYNKISNCAVNTYDVSGIGSYKMDAKGTVEIDHNIIYDCNDNHAFVAYYHDNGSLNFLNHHNVCYDVDLAMILNNPNYNNKFYNNTFLSTKPIATGNMQNPFENNAFVGAVWNGNQFYNNILPSVYYGTGATFKNNILFSNKDLNFNSDFTLGKNSVAIGKGITTALGENADIGAYAFGEEKWIAGHDFSKEISAEYSLSKLDENFTAPTGKMFIESDYTSTPIYSNTSFENTIADWGGFGYEIVKSDATVGEYSAKIKEGWIEKTYDVSPEQMYKYSGDVKVEKFGNTCEFGVHFLDDNYNITNQGSFMITTTDYETFETVFSVPKGCKKMRIFAASWAGGTYINIDNLKCELITK